MSEGRHTDLPWDYDGEDTVASQDWGGDGYEIFSRDADGNVAEPIGVVLEEEDAAFIVKAANSHDLLVEQNRVMRELLAEAIESESEFETEWNKAARAILEQAED